MINKMTFDLPPNFGDSGTLDMILHCLHKFHAQSLQAAKQKAIVWLNFEDYMKAEKAFANSPSVVYVPPFGAMHYFPIANDKVVENSFSKQGVMEIETVCE